MEFKTLLHGIANQTINAGQYLSGVQTIQGDANLIAENIVSGKTIFGVSGSTKKRQVINVTLTGSYASQISGYGAGINQNGVLIIWAMTNTTTYEAVSFSASSIIGTQGSGWGITGFDTSNPSGVPYACTISGLSDYDTLTVKLDANSRNGTNDYTGIAVTVTGS